MGYTIAHRRPRAIKENQRCADCKHRHRNLRPVPGVSCETRVPQRRYRTDRRWGVPWFQRLHCSRRLVCRMRDMRTRMPRRRRQSGIEEYHGQNSHGRGIRLPRRNCMRWRRLRPHLVSGGDHRNNPCRDDDPLRRGRFHSLLRHQPVRDHGNPGGDGRAHSRAGARVSRDRHRRRAALRRSRLLPRHLESRPDQAQHGLLAPKLSAQHGDPGDLARVASRSCDPMLFI